MAGNYQGTGIGIVFVLIVRRANLIDRRATTGVSGRGTSPVSVFHRAKIVPIRRRNKNKNNKKRARNKAASYLLYQRNTSD